MTQAKPLDIEAALRETMRLQGEAADPGASVWVSANAGTGKTHVLTNRVMRLMLAGTAPERILCLTYTKAAAAEMSKRVFDKLAGWATADDQALAHELAALTGAVASGEMLARARVLFAHAIESPGGLKVQTIHAFCQSLLQRFPLEAGVPPGFSVLDDAMARRLERDAIDGVLAAATSEPDGALAQALRTAVTYASDDRFDDMLRQALGHRHWLEAVARHLPDDRDEDPLASIERLYRRHFGVREATDLQAIEAEMAGLMPDAVLRRLVDALSGGSKTDGEQAERLRPAVAGAAGGERIAALRAFLLTGTGEPRKALMTKALRETHADLDQRATEAQGRFLALEAERRGLAVVTETMALTRLALAAMQRFSDAKARRAALDFDDLIERTVNLLGSGGNSADWVLFKLDGGLDHVLVDESQDTSPRQWQIVKALAGEFFADVGARAQVRTLFAVGDEKQSIYSFQGAAPKLFAAMGTLFAGQVKAAGLAWRDIPLQLSFRTVAPVLDAVDATFASPARTPGLGAAAEAIRHYARRAGQAGLVEIWPTETPEEADASEAWSPLDERPVAVPATRLAQRIARTIRRWLDDKVILASTGRAIRPGDILILVRKRNPFAGPMVAALKAARIPVAGADRIDIMNQIAVEDLVSLGNFLTLPEDDLALAEVLKSPIFGLDDDDLIAFAAKRQGTLWKALLDAAEANPRLGEARDLLRRWRREADFSPPYEFFASILDHDGIRRRLVSRLGAEAAEPIDQLLALAIRYDEESPPSLPGFLHWLSEAPREIKRDMEHGRDEVRVMTVHGAKGLEAPIVFLPDTCTTRSGMQAGGLVGLPDMTRPADMPPPFCWPVKGTSSLAPIAAANAARQDDEAEERHRLLYVAMTRARDRLYVAGFEGAKGRAQGCWYDLIEEAIASGAAGAVETLTGDDGREVRRISAPQAAPNEIEKTSLTTMHEAAAPPDWATRPAPREAVLSVPVAPSRLAPYDIDEEGEPKTPPRRTAPDLAEPPMLPPGPLAADNRFLRGTVTHALLQHLPGLAPEARAAAAEGFVAVRGAALPARMRASVVKETLAILTHPEFAPLFGPGSRAEVPIVAELAPPAGRRGPALEVSGQIDRLVVLPDSVLIVDYKTNRPPPTEVAGVAETYLLQLAAYRQALGAIYPDRRVRAALLWTDGPRLMEIPSAVLDAAEARLIDAVKA
jgi:ATP-dependent helicase/nuclease subunit A